MKVTIPMDLRWRYASTRPMERFAAGLRERRIRALECDRCRRRYLPPRPFCGECRQSMDRWVDVADVGTLVAWTVYRLPILDGRTGAPRPAPVGIGLVRLDGADTTVNHFLAEADPTRLVIGARVRAVWRDELRGAMDDVLHFGVCP